MNYNDLIKLYFSLQLHTNLHLHVAKLQALS